MITMCEDHPNTICEGEPGTFDHPYYNELCHESMSLEEFRGENVPCAGRCSGCLCYAYNEVGNLCKCPLIH